MSRYRRQPPRYGVLTLALASLLVVAPVLAQDSRGVAPGSVDKAELFAAGTARSMRALSVAVVEGEGFRDELLKENGAGSARRCRGPRTEPSRWPPGRSQLPIRISASSPSWFGPRSGFPLTPRPSPMRQWRSSTIPRGWGDIDGVSFARSDVDAEADIVLTLASPATTEVLCGELPTHGYLLRPRPTGEHQRCSMGLGCRVISERRGHRGGLSGLRHQSRIRSLARTPARAVPGSLESSRPPCCSRHSPSGVALERLAESCTLIARFPFPLFLCSARGAEVSGCDHAGLCSPARQTEALPDHHPSCGSSCSPRSRLSVVA